MGARHFIVGSSLPVLVGASACAATSYPDWAACMWEINPTSTAQYLSAAARARELNTANRFEEMVALSRAMEGCPSPRKPDMAKLRAELEKTRPPETGPDTTNAQVHIPDAGDSARMDPED